MQQHYFFVWCGVMWCGIVWYGRPIMVWINPSGVLCQHEMGGPSNPPPLPFPSPPLSFPSSPPFPSLPLEVGPLKYS